MSEIIKPKIGDYKHHLLVCTGTRCTQDGAAQTLFDNLGDKFKAAGLQPGGDKKDGQRGWTQAVPLDKFQIKGPVAASISINGKT